MKNLIKQSSRIFYRSCKDLLNLLLPSTCLHCGIIAENSIHPSICRDCLNSFRSLSPGFGEQQLLNRLHPCYIDDVIIGWAFDDALRDAIHAIKYRQMAGLGRALAEYAVQTTALSRISDIHCRVLPIPLHPSRLRKRGYNQSAGIAAGITGNSELVDETSLLRCKNTVSQTHLDRTERRKNMQNAFQLEREDLVAGAVIVLVDDVLTTGATMNSCARVLKRAGAARVIGCSLASPLEFEVE